MYNRGCLTCVTQIILRLAQQNFGAICVPFVYCKYVARIVPQYPARFVRAFLLSFSWNHNFTGRTSWRHFAGRTSWRHWTYLSRHLCITAFYSMSREKHCAWKYCGTVCHFSAASASFLATSWQQLKYFSARIATPPFPFSQCLLLIFELVSCWRTLKCRWLSCKNVSMLKWSEKYQWVEICRLMVVFCFVDWE